MPPAVAVLNIGVVPCWGKTCGDMLEAIARIAPKQPNKAMARASPRRNCTILHDPSFRVKIPEKGFLDVHSKLFWKVQMDSKRGLGLNAVARDRAPDPKTTHSA
jgi:hypothetical protein